MQDKVTEIMDGHDSVCGRCIKFWQALLENKGLFSPTMVYFIEATIRQLEFRLRDGTSHVLEYKHDGN